MISKERKEGGRKVTEEEEADFGVGDAIGRHQDHVGHHGCNYGQVEADEHAAA